MKCTTIASKMSKTLHPFTHSFGLFTPRPRPDRWLLLPMRYVVIMHVNERVPAFADKISCALRHCGRLVYTTTDALPNLLRLGMNDAASQVGLRMQPCAESAAFPRVIDAHRMTITGASEMIAVDGVENVALANRERDKSNTTPAFAAVQNGDNIPQSRRQRGVFLVP